jgi:MraZ protein
VYFGSSKLSLDHRGRVAVPTKHHAAIQTECERKLTLTRDPDGCVLMFPRPVWERATPGIVDMDWEHRALQRMLLGNACDVEMDSANRVLIPPELREAAGLAIDGKVMLIGVGPHFEIWEPDAYERHMATIKDSMSPSVKFKWPR